MPKFSIIIPVCGQEEMTKKCVESIKKNSSDYEVILVVNGPERVDVECDWKIVNEKNLGFPIAVNQGIKKATGEIIVILNNDVIVTPGWLDHLADHLQYADIVGPVTNNVSGPQKIYVEFNSNSKSINDFTDYRYRNHKLDSTPWHRLVFFCVAIKKEVIDKIGLLDEQFSPGNFEDDDFCLRAVEAGFHLVIAEDIFIYHYGSQTHMSLKLDYQNLLKTNRAKFEAKWPAEKQTELRQKAQKIDRKLHLSDKKTLALVMIVKNEEKGLENAVNSAKNICDDIYITVDDSSTDRTLEIARRLTQNVKTFKWCDDFSAMHNFAHSEVKSDWILFLDGHEIIKNPECVNKYLNSKDDGLLCYVKMENGTMFPSPRIYKNGCKFNGALHEQLDCKTTTPTPEIIIEHHRLDFQDIASQEERAKQRDDQSPRILGGQIKKDKHNTRAAFHLAMFYQSKHDWKNTLKYQKQYLKYSDVPGGRWFMYYNMALCFYEQRKYLKAWLATCEAYKINPYRWEISELRGFIFFFQKNWEKASEYLVESFNENKGDVSFLPKQKNTSAVWSLIGECFVNQGEYFKASEAFMAGYQNCKVKEFKKLLMRRCSWAQEMSKKIKNA